MTAIPAISSLNWNITITPSRSGKTTWEARSLNLQDLPSQLREELLRGKPKSFKLPETIAEADVRTLHKAAEMRVIRTFAKSDRVATMHTNTYLTFTALPIGQLEAANKQKIHHSARHNGRQGSAYYVAMINGRPAYVRRANHWGVFSTTVYEGTAKAEKLFAETEGDSYGRVGYQIFDWKLDGGQQRADGESPATSQAGYIYIDEE